MKPPAHSTAQQRQKQLHGRRDSTPGGRGGAHEAAWSGRTAMISAHRTPNNECSRPCVKHPTGCRTYVSPMASCTAAHCRNRGASRCSPRVSPQLHRQHTAPTRGTHARQRPVRPWRSIQHGKKSPRGSPPRPPGHSYIGTRWPCDARNPYLYTLDCRRTRSPDRHRRVANHVKRHLPGCLQPPRQPTLAHSPPPRRAFGTTIALETQIRACLIGALSLSCHP